jgi:hypothetical protein
MSGIPGYGIILQQIACREALSGQQTPISRPLNPG